MEEEGAPIASGDQWYGGGAESLEQQVVSLENGDSSMSSKLGTGDGIGPEY